MIGLIGNGSWATAIAKILTDNQHQVFWWMRKEVSVNALVERGHNQDYLSSVSFSSAQIQPTTDLKAVIGACEWIIICVPSAYLHHVFKHISPEMLQNKRIISAVKGILPEVNMLLCDYLEQNYQIPGTEYISITGPCHAEEIAQERLSYLTFSCLDLQKAEKIAALFKNNYLHTVVNTDLKGTQYAAVLKNIYALGAGIAHGLGYGDNFMSVYVTNCYRELHEYIVQLSGNEQNLISSAYLGDLLVTCFSLHSRNRRLGTLLGKGYSIESATAELGMIAEGYAAAKGMKHILERQQIELPILQLIYEILWKSRKVSEAFKAIEELMH